MVLKVYVQDQVMVSMVISSCHYESMLEPVIKCPVSGGPRSEEERGSKKKTNRHRYTHRGVRRGEGDAYTQRQTYIQTDRDREGPESFCGKEAGDDETESCLLLLLLIAFVVLTVGRVDPG